jgi:hypothetical protein
LAGSISALAIATTRGQNHRRLVLLVLLVLMAVLMAVLVAVRQQ